MPGFFVDRPSPSPARLRTKVAWALALAATLYLYRGAYWFTVEEPYRLGDFFQEWASAKNYFEGQPIYTPQEITAWHYLRQTPDMSKQIFVRVNGHPPTCVLLALPLARLDYAHALFLWNGLTLVALAAATALVLRFELGTWRTWLWLPAATLLVSNPLLQHLILGQLGIWLLLLIVGAVLADDRDRQVTAGLLLGTATALKLFPGLLFLYFVIHRRRRAVVAGLGVCLLWNAVSAAVLGTQAYEHFVRYAMPEVLHYRDWWANYSITGTWFKLFQPWSRQSLPLWHDPTTAQLGAWLTMATVVGSATYVAYRSRRHEDARRTGFAVLITTMVLTTPIAWDHYFLLLLWPLVRLAVRLPRGWAIRGPFYTALFFVWLNPLVLYAFATGQERAATPAEILLIISWPFYALLTFYGLGVWQTLHETVTATAPAVRPATAAQPALQTAASG